MADARQTSKGKWVISGITFKNNDDVPNGLEVPITLTYPNSDPVDVTIKKQKQVVQTNWATPLGQRIDTTKIGCTSQTVPYGDKRYKITKVNWGQVVPYVPEREYKVELTPTSTALTSSVGSVEFTVEYVEYEGETVKSRLDVSEEADWIYDSDIITDQTHNVFEFDNTGETQATVVIKATYDDRVSNEARVTVPAQESYTLVLEPQRSVFEEAGSATFTTKYDGRDVSSSAVYVCSQSDEVEVQQTDNIFEFTYDGEDVTKTVVLTLYATYNGVQSNSVTVEVEHNKQTPTEEYTLRINPKGSTIEYNGTQNYTATLVHTIGETETTTDVTDSTVFSVSDDTVASFNGNTLTGHNTGNTRQTLRVTGNYVSGSIDVDDEATIIVNAQAHHEHTYALELTPTATTLDNVTGSVEFKVDYVEFEDGVVILRNDISTEAEWEYDSDITENSLNEFEFNNTGATQKIVEIKATYEGLESNVAIVTVPGFRLVISPDSCELSETGSTAFTTSFEINGAVGTDVTTASTFAFVYDGSGQGIDPTIIANLEGNVITAHNDTTSAFVYVRATYEYKGITYTADAEVWIWVGESYSLTISPTTEDGIVLPYNGQVEFDAFLNVERDGHVQTVITITSAATGPNASLVFSTENEDASRINHDYGLYNLLQAGNSFVTEPAFTNVRATYRKDGKSWTSEDTLVEIEQFNPQNHVMYTIPRNPGTYDFTVSTNDDLSSREDVSWTTTIMYNYAWLDDNGDPQSESGITITVTGTGDVIDGHDTDDPRTKTIEYATRGRYIDFEVTSDDTLCYENPDYVPPSDN